MLDRTWPPHKTSDIDQITELLRNSHIFNTSLSLSPSLNHVSAEDGTPAKSTGPFIKVQICNVSEAALCDSGNLWRSAISQSYLKRLPPKFQNLKKSTLDSITSADKNHSLQVLGETARSLPITLNSGTPDEVTYHFKPVVLRDLSHSINLSRQFMKEKCMDLLLSTDEISINGKKFPFLSNPSSDQKNILGVYVDHDVEVPAMSTIVTLGKLSSNAVGQEGMVQACSTFAAKSNIHGWQSALTKANDASQIPIGLINVLNHPVLINKGAFYGAFHRVTEDPSSGQINSIEDMGKEKKPPVNPVDGDPQTLDFLHGPTTDANQDARIHFLWDKLQLDKADLLKTESDRAQALSLFLRNFDLFSFDGTYGRTSLISHGIDVIPGTKPINIRYRPINPILEESLKVQIDKWMKNGIITETTSSWNAPLVPVVKGTKVRWCLDYRRLNSVTIKDSHPIGDCLDTLNRLGSSRVFSTIDSSGAFHAVPVKAEDQEKTAFSTPFGTFAFAFMPFGLTNAPSTYARLVRRVLEGIPFSTALPFLDDCVIHSTSLPNHLRDLQVVFNAYRKAGLKLGHDKCAFFRSRVRYLGHMVSADGQEVMPEYVAAVQKWPLPCTRKETRIFLGKTSYYRRFIKDYQKKAGAMLEKLQKDGLGDNEKFVPSDAFIQSFHCLKNALVSAPVLGYPDWKSGHPFILDTDFSQETGSIGAVLSQYQNGVERPIYYGSLKLNKTMRNWSAAKGELGAVIIFLRRLKYYLQGRPFTLRTDAKALKSIYTMDEPPGIIIRWLQTLANFTFEVQHRAGKSHQNADSLSRITHAEEDEECTDVSDETNMKMLASITEPRKVTSAAEMKEHQLNDPDLSILIHLIHENRSPTEEMIRGASKDAALYLKMFNELKIDSEGVLRWERSLPPFNDNGKGKRRVVLVPEELQGYVTIRVHEQGHQGREATVRRMQSMFYFPRMESMAEMVIQRCKTCQEKDKAPKSQRGTHFPSSLSGYPFGQLSVDFVGPLPTTKNGYRYILTVLDTFSRWLEAFPAKNATSETVMTLLLREIFSRYGLPETIRSDRGSHFTSIMIDELAKSLKIDWRFTPAYNPNSNPVERAHRTLNKLLGKLNNNCPKTWDVVLPTALYVMRSSVSRTTGLAPFQVLFGSAPNSSLQLLFRDPEEERLLQSRSPETHRQLIQSAHKWARANISSSVIRQRLQYMGTTPSYAIRQPVWLFTPVVRQEAGKKFTTYWTGPWSVFKKINPLVYEIQPPAVWLRKNHQVVSVDRLKPYIASDEDLKDPSKHEPPPMDANLDMSGDEFAENIRIYFKERDPDDTLDEPITNMPRPVLQQPQLLQQPEEPQAVPDPGQPILPMEQPAPVRHRRNPLDTLRAEALNITGNDLPQTRLRRRRLDPDFVYARDEPPRAQARQEPSDPEPLGSSNNSQGSEEGVDDHDPLGIGSLNVLSAALESAMRP